jgi:hypothetical protein
MDPSVSDVHAKFTRMIVVHDFLGFRRVCAQWVPWELTEEQKHNRVSISSRCWSNNTVKEIFFSRIIIGDEPLRTTKNVEYPIGSTSHLLLPKDSARNRYVNTDGARELQFPFLQHYQKRETTKKGERYAKQSICKVDCTHSYNFT